MNEGKDQDGSAALRALADRLRTVAGRADASVLRAAISVLEFLALYASYAGAESRPWPDLHSHAMAAVARAQRWHELELNKGGHDGDQGPRR